MPLGKHFASWALGHLLGFAALPAAAPPPIQKRDAQHKFLQHREAHAYSPGNAVKSWEIQGFLLTKRGMPARRPNQ